MMNVSASYLMEIRYHANFRVMGYGCGLKCQFETDKGLVELLCKKYLSDVSKEHLNERQ